MPTDRLPLVPTDWTVWVFTDSHGVTSALVAALQEAGLIDGQRRWSAPPRTALVGCGDYIDRGGDIPGMVALLRRLSGEAEAAGDPADRSASDTGAMLEARLPRIPDDWQVWACSDVHGVTSALVAALQEAGVVDAQRHWIAPPKTALVGCGDYLDRGGDVSGLVDLLHTLEGEAQEAGGAVHLARGNHEVMPLMVRRGEHEWLETWLEYGGRATLSAYGCGWGETLAPERMASALETCAPGLFEWIEGLSEAVRWRDVIFVHGGLPPNHALSDLGRTTEEHLWIRSGFFDADWSDTSFDAYRRDGIDRVVFGHTPQPDGPTLFHAGHSLDIDTNAVGNPIMSEDAVQELTLLGLSGSGSFEDARFITIATGDAPDRMQR